MHVSLSLLALFQKLFFLFLKAMIIYKAKTKKHNVPVMNVQHETLKIEKCWGLWCISSLHVIGVYQDEFWLYCPSCADHIVWFLSCTCKETDIKEAVMCHSTTQSTQVEHLCPGLLVWTYRTCCHCISIPREPQSWNEDSQLSIFNSYIPAGWDKGGK